MKVNIRKILSAKVIVVIFMITAADALYAQQGKKDVDTVAAYKHSEMFYETDTVEPCRARNKKIYSAVSAIDAMPLRCDSIFVDEADSGGRKHFYIGKRLFFDSNNRLRKYRTYKREVGNDADYSIYRFYYDENGQLIYFDYNIRRNGIDTDEYCALHRGIVKEYDCILYDRRYEKDGYTTKGVGCGQWQKVGKPVKLYNYNSLSYSLKSFSDTRTLLRVLELYKYPYYSDMLEFQTKEFGISRVADEKQRRGLLFGYVIDEKEQKGELKNSKLKFSYKETQGDTTVEKDYVITFTLDSNNRVYKYRASKGTTVGYATKLDESTEAYYDTNGSLFIIEYMSDVESFRFYLENGVISYCAIFRNKDTEGIDYEALGRLKRSFVGKKLDDITLKNINLADYAASDRLGDAIEALKKIVSPIKWD